MLLLLTHLLFLLRLFLLPQVGGQQLVFLLDLLVLLPEHDDEGLIPIFNHVLSPRIPERPGNFRPFPATLDHKGCNFPIFST